MRTQRDVTRCRSLHRSLIGQLRARAEKLQPRRTRSTRRASIGFQERNRGGGDQERSLPPSAPSPASQGKAVPRCRRRGHFDFRLVAFVCFVSFVVKASSCCYAQGTDGQSIGQFALSVSATAEYKKVSQASPTMWRTSIVSSWMGHSRRTRRRGSRSARCCFARTTCSRMASR